MSWCFLGFIAFLITWFSYFDLGDGTGQVTSHRTSTMSGSSSDDSSKGSGCPSTWPPTSSGFFIESDFNLSRRTSPIFLKFRLLRLRDFTSSSGSSFLLVGGLDEGRLVPTSELIGEPETDVVGRSLDTFDDVFTHPLLFSWTRYLTVKSTRVPYTSKLYRVQYKNSVI